MNCNLRPLCVLAVLLVSGLGLGGCGDDDGAEANEDSGDGGDPGTGGVSSNGGAVTGGRSASTGGRTASTGGRSAGTGGQSETAPGDCELPGEPVEHCYVDNEDREGTAVCSEYYQAGLAMLFCMEPESGGCPENEELSGKCIGGLTSSYYYADASNEGFWVAAEPGCEVNAGVWCGR